jgi:hypothetical protein
LTSTEGKTRIRIRTEMTKTGWSCEKDEENKHTGMGLEIHFTGKRPTE